MPLNKVLKKLRIHPTLPLFLPSVRGSSTFKDTAIQDSATMPVPDSCNFGLLVGVKCRSEIATQCLGFRFTQRILIPMPVGEDEAFDINEKAGARLISASLSI